MLSALARLGTQSSSLYAVEAVLKGCRLQSRDSMDSQCYSPGLHLSGLAVSYRCVSSLHQRNGLLRGMVQQDFYWWYLCSHLLVIAVFVSENWCCVSNWSTPPRMVSPAAAPAILVAFPISDSRRDHSKGNAPATNACRFSETKEWVLRRLPCYKAVCESMTATSFERFWLNLYSSRLLPFWHAEASLVHAVTRTWANQASVSD